MNEVKRRRRVPGWVKALVVLGVAGIGFPCLMTQVLFTAWKYGGRSMEPSVARNARFFAARLVSPEHGDVVVFEGENGEPLAARVIALGGDTVEIADGRVRVNGTPIEQVDLGPADPAESGLWCHGERLGDYRWLIVEDPAAPSALAETTVPPDHVYVLGDRRAGAVDSRTLGPIPESDIRGVMAWIYHPGDFNDALRCRPPR